MSSALITAVLTWVAITALTILSQLYAKWYDSGAEVKFAEKYPVFGSVLEALHAIGFDPAKFISALIAILGKK